MKLGKNLKLEITFSEFQDAVKRFPGRKIPLLTNWRFPPKLRRIITCSIYAVDKTEPLCLLGLGKAICNPIDEFDGSIGRKISLTRCLKGIAPHSKKFRGYVWTAIRDKFPDFKVIGNYFVGVIHVDVPSNILSPEIKKQMKKVDA